SNPYTATSDNALLEQFRDHWNDNYADVARDVAHLMTGAGFGLVAGLAYNHVICNPSSAYGWSSQESFNLASRTATTAHELGHNWGANHCDGDADCAIMCSITPGCSNSLTTFGSNSVAAITAMRDAATCLTSPKPLAMCKNV